MRTHVLKTVSSCFAALHQIRSSQRLVSKPVLPSLVSSLLSSQLDYGSATLAGIPTYVLDWLQSVLNATAKLMHGRRSMTIVIPFLRWLSAPERIKLQLAVLVFRCRSHTAPAYLAIDLHWAANNFWKRLRSSATHKMIVTRARSYTIGDRAFGVAAARVWNNLPLVVRSATSLNTSKKHLKTHLFQSSYSRWRFVLTVFNQLLHVLEVVS